MKMKMIGISIFAIMLLSLILGRFADTEKFGVIIFAILFIGAGIYGLTLRIVYDMSKKVTVSGIMTKLEKNVDAEGSTSYQPHYAYDYKGDVYILRSPIQAFWYKKTKHIGDEILITCLVRNPNVSKIKKPIYTTLEYLTTIVIITIGFIFLYYGIYT